MRGEFSSSIYYMHFVSSFLQCKKNGNWRTIDREIVWRRSAELMELATGQRHILTNHITAFNISSRMRFQQGESHFENKCCLISIESAYALYRSCPLFIFPKKYDTGIRFCGVTSDCWYLKARLFSNVHSRKFTKVIRCLRKYDT
jgi:hypothetical protein